MCYILERVNSAVRKIVARIDAPFVTSMRVRCELQTIQTNKISKEWARTHSSAARDTVCFTCLYTIGNKVIHIAIIILHILLHSQCCFPFLNLSSSHFVKKSKRLFNRPVPPGTIHFLLSVLFYLFSILKVKKSIM